MANRYWVGGTGSWSTASNWSETSGGGAITSLLDSYSNTNIDTWISSVYPTGSIRGVAQSFNASLDGSSGSFTLYLRKVGTPSVGVYIRLYAHTGTYGTDGTPTGSILSYQYVPFTSINASETAITVDFNGAVPFVSGTKYFVSVEPLGGDASNYLEVGVDGSSPSHGGNSATYNGTSWTADNTKDMAFIANRAIKPGIADDVFFDANSGAGTVTADEGSCHDLDFTGFTGTFTQTTNVITITGDLTLGSGMTMDQGFRRFDMDDAEGGSTAHTITTNGIALNEIDIIGQGYYTFADTFTADELGYYGDSWASGVGNGAGIDFNGQTFNLNYLYINGNGKATFDFDGMTMNLGIGVGGDGYYIPYDDIITSGTDTWNIEGGFFIDNNGVSGGFGIVLGNFIIDISNSYWLQLDTNGTGSYTFTSLDITDDGTGVVEFYGLPITVSGNLTILGSATSPVLVTSTGNQTVLTVNGTNSLTNVVFRNITAGGTASWTGTNIGDGGSNSGITYSTGVTRYWVGGTGSWTDTAHWSTSSGGATGASAPVLPQDTPVFDTNSTTAASQTITINTQHVGNLDFSGLDDNTFVTYSNDINVYGDINMTNITALTNSSANLYIYADCTITSNGRAMAGRRVYIGAGTTTLADNTTMQTSSSYATEIYSGATLTTNNFNLTTSAISVSGTMNAGSSIITMNGNYSDTTGTFNAGTSTLRFNGANQTHFFSGTLYDVELTYGATQTLTLSQVSALTIHNLTASNTQTRTLKLPYQVTTTITGTLTIGGSATKIATITSAFANPSYIATISYDKDIVTDYMTLSYTSITGGKRYFAGHNSTNGGSVTGWRFATLLTGAATSTGVASTTPNLGFLLHAIGTSNGVTTAVDGTLTYIHRAIGTSNGIASVTGAMHYTFRVLGAIAGAATMTGSMHQVFKVDGVALGDASATASAQQVFALFAETTGMTEMTGALSHQVHVTAASAAGGASASAYGTIPYIQAPENDSGEYRVVQ